MCRFSYIAICCLAILHRLDRINVEKAVNYIVSCKNLDGGFGCTLGGESHAGQSMFCLLWIFSFFLIVLFILYFVCIHLLWISCAYHILYSIVVDFGH